jgi:radical SAM superfamily enzyme YgiQ (UPF0313 family)
MKITLIQPRKPFSGKVSAERHWELTRPFSILFIASALEQHPEFRVEIIDFETRALSGQSYHEIIRRTDSKLYGITASTFSRFEAIEIAKCIKMIRPEAVVMMGGVHFMHCARETLERIPEIDIVVRGEGEYAAVKCAKAISLNHSLSQIQGITYREGRAIIATPDSEIFQDLDAIPSYTKLNWQDYPETVFNHPEKIPAISIMSSRGCPYHCIFCSKSGMQYRMRSAKQVVDEIEYFSKALSIQGFNFLDLTFTAKSDHVEALCKELLHREMDIKWWCESRANIKLYLLDLMKEAGCVSLALGVESGSPRVLTKISKGITRDQVIQFCEKCNDLNIYTTAYLMFSFPDETEEDVEMTLELIDTLENIGGFISCQLQPTMIFPGTKLEAFARKEGLLPPDFFWCEPYFSSLNARVNQLTNTPLFIHKLSAYYLEEVVKKLEVHRAAKTISEMNLGVIARKTLHAFRSNPRRLFKYAPSIANQFLRLQFTRSRLTSSSL